MYRRVVIPLDGSELAQGVLPYVAEVIRDRRSQVYLLSVAPLVRGVLPTVADARPSSAAISLERRRVEHEWVEYLRTVARQWESDAADVQVSVCFGRPADEILAFADKVDADLVAMSAHGRSGLSRWVFGSVADRVLRGSVYPVLLVRPEIRLRSMSSPWSGVQTEGLAEMQASEKYVKRRIAYRRILVPLDGSELAEQVLPYVKAFIDPNRTRVFLIRVLATGLGDRTIALLTSYPPGLQLATTVLHRAELQLRTYLRSVAAVLREEGAVVHTTVRRGSPADEILAYAAEVDADLLIMTTHGLSGLSRWVYGNVAGRVLQGAQSPVLLVRPRSE